ncbi:hypothetical protein ABZX85_33895 [Streptomyces sp. NPDC004539]|uniref:hypothetical protein n=1 Tax=Streptomyces sp. NPDC004539 TaxID=3154280 RepID=UPI00339FDF47
MQRRGHIFRLTAVSALVVFALTGFSTGRGHGSSHSGGGGGGGCSSSRQNHDSSSSSGGGSSSSGGSSSGNGTHYRDNDYDDDDNSGSSGGGSSAKTPTVVERGRVSLVECATGKTPYATVKVTNPNASVEWFRITVRFLDADGAVVAEPVTKELVRGKQTESVQVPVGDDGLAAKVVRCEVEATAPVA